MQRLLITTFLFITTVLTTQGQTGYDINWRGATNQFDIPFEYENNLIIVSLVFEKIFPLRFIFDTGAEHTILVQRQITDLLDIDYKRRFTIYGADMSTELYAYLIQGVSLDINQLKMVNRSMLVLEDDYFRFDEFGGIQIHGILGADMFRRFIVEINYSKKVITLHDPATYVAPKKHYFECPVDIHRGKPYINAVTTLANQTTINARYLIDSGASLPIILYTNTDPDLQVPETVIPSRLGVGLGGFINGYIGRISSVFLENIEFNEVITSFQELPEEVDSVYIHNRNGIIGNQLLDKFTIIIDYVNGKLYLRPGKKKDRKFPYDRSGLILIADGRNLNRFYVAGIVPNSPAEEAGIKAGDRVRKIKGLPARFFRLPHINRILRGKEGKKVKIQHTRNGIRYNVKLVLRDII